MRAMVLHEQSDIAQEPLRLEEVEDPEPGPGEVRLKVHTCGVCRTDLHEVEGDLDLHKRPVIPGHEIVGTVEKLGEGARRFEIGDRVGIAWLYSTPEDCEFRQRGLENLCPGAKFTGWDADGGYAEMTVVPEEFAYPVPDEIDDAHASPLLCAGIIGYRSLVLAGAESAPTLGMYGFGASAHIGIQIARHWGCEVYVFTRSEDHKRHAEELGAAWVGEAGDHPGTRLRASIIYAPAGPLVPQALQVLERGGTLVCAGIYMTPIPQFEYDLIYGERVLRSVMNATREDGEGLMRVAGEVPVRTDVTLFPLEEANEALRQVKESEVSGAAVLQVAES
ncbi:MAG: zinc-dependent alcohol dehydrogenase family protein [Armatimonadota bacterium]|nr:zinc-dependent alcohol dehydrogenase family protein [Armatimonadota bacterium]